MVLSAKLFYNLDDTKHRKRIELDEFIGTFYLNAFDSLRLVSESAFAALFVLV